MTGKAFAEKLVLEDCGHMGSFGGHCVDCIAKVFDKAVDAEVKKYKEALQWTSGAAEFAPGGVAREGFEKQVLPLIS